MVQINWTKQAVSDLREISSYIGKDSLKYAKLQIVRIKSKTEILKQHLDIGSPVTEIRRPDIRQLIEGNYRIIYKVLDSNSIDILTVHHSSRDLKKEKYLNP